MKMPVRILLIFLCAALIIALPFAVSSPNMLNNVKMELMNGEDDEDEIDFGRLFFSVAKAEEDEEVEEEVLDEGEFGSHPEWVLPTDFSVVPPAPNADLYTEDGYEDETIRVKIEKTQFDEGTTVIAAYVQIADPCQLRTGVHNTKKLASTPGKSVSFLAKEWNAVIALNGDNYLFEPQKKTFEYRMGNKIKSKGNKTKDILIIDDQGDFHLYVKSQGINKAPDELKSANRKLVNAFTFGPALVIDGQLQQLDDGYGYNPHGREPRAAIGQMGKLSYVMVIVTAQDRSGKSGMSQAKLAEYMHELGCVQAFNMDGGNSAEMVFGKQIFKGMPGGDERTLNDIIYFATMQPNE